MPVLQHETLAKFVSQIFQEAGASEKTAHLVANSLVASNLAGHDSHGIVRVRQYLNNIAGGDLDPAATPQIVRETAVIAAVDAKRGFGQVAAHLGITIAVEKAKEQGLAATGLFNCGHVGRLGEWVQMAADQNTIGLAFCNGGGPGGAVAPFGGAARLLGTNPIAAAVPVKDRAPVVLDFATSAVAEGKVRIARNSGKSIPEGWIANAQGEATTDPNDLYNGGMLLPAANHKGYSLSLLVEFLGGLLTSSGSACLPGFVMGNGVLFLVLAVDSFRTAEAFLADAAALAEKAKAVPPATGFDEVLLPGEPEQRAAEKRRADGIPIDETTWRELVEEAGKVGVATPAL